MKNIRLVFVYLLVVTTIAYSGEYRELWQKSQLIRDVSFRFYLSNTSDYSALYSPTNSSLIFINNNTKEVIQNFQFCNLTIAGFDNNIFIFSHTYFDGTKNKALYYEYDCNTKQLYTRELDFLDLSSKSIGSFNKKFLTSKSNIDDIDLYSLDKNKLLHSFNNADNTNIDKISIAPNGKYALCMRGADVFKYFIDNDSIGQIYYPPISMLGAMQIRVLNDNKHFIIYSSNGAGNTTTDIFLYNFESFEMLKHYSSEEKLYNFKMLNDSIFTCNSNVINIYTQEILNMNPKFNNNNAVYKIMNSDTLMYNYSQNYYTKYSFNDSTIDTIFAYPEGPACLFSTFKMFSKYNEAIIDSTIYKMTSGEEIAKYSNFPLGMKQINDSCYLYFKNDNTISLNKYKTNEQIKEYSTIYSLTKDYSESDFSKDLKLHLYYDWDSSKSYLCDLEKQEIINNNKSNFIALIANTSYYYYYGINLKNWVIKSIADTTTLYKITLPSIPQSTDYTHIGYIGSCMIGDKLYYYSPFDTSLKVINMKNMDSSSVPAPVRIRKMAVSSDNKNIAMIEGNTNHFRLRIINADDLLDLIVIDNVSNHYPYFQLSDDFQYINIASPTWMKMIQIDRSVLSVDEANEAKNSLAVYPNPAANYITLNSIDDLPIEAIKLYDESNKLVYSAENINSTTYILTICDLPSGCYFIMNKDKMYKFIKS